MGGVCWGVGEGEEEEEERRIGGRGGVVEVGRRGVVEVGKVEGGVV